MKTLTTILFTLFISLCASPLGHARQHDMATQQKQIEKEATLLVKKLNITGDTVAKFTKIYAEYRLDMEKTFANNKPVEPKMVNGKKQRLSDTEIDQNITNGFKTGRKMIDIREKYYKKFKTVLPPSKIDRMFRYEKKIMDRKRHEMEKRMKKRDKNRSEAAKRHAKSAKKRAEANVKRAEKRAEMAQKRAEMAQKRAEMAQKRAEMARKKNNAGDDQLNANES